jgi:hypothetical protein
MKKIYLMLIIALILLTACEIKKPTMPTWFMDLNIPIINERYYVSDLVDSVNIVMGENEVLTVTTSGEATTNEFGTLPFTPDVNVEGLPIWSTGLDLTIPFEDQNGKVGVAYAEIAEGIFKSRFNNLQSGVEITLTFYDLYLPNNQNLVLTSNNPGNWVTTNLEGLHLGVANSDQVINQIHLSFQITPSLPSGIQVATFDFQANETIQFGEFRGTLNNYPIGLEDSGSLVNIDYPYGLDQAINLEDAYLQITLHNYLGFGSTFSGKLKATNSSGQSRIIDILDEYGNTYQIEPATEEGPRIIEIQLGQNMAQLLQIMPTTIQVINGHFLISSGTNIGSLRPTDTMLLFYTVRAPLTFTLHAHEITIAEEQEFNIPEENRERIQKNAISASLNLEIQNKLPIGASAKLFFSTTPSIDTNNPSTYNFMKEAAIYSANLQPDFQNVNLTLNKDELNVFTSEQVFMRFAFSFEETGTPVTIHASTMDYIHIKGMMSARVLIEKED